MELYPGTLDAIVLQILAARPLHGYAIARAIESRSDDLLSVDQGSLYPALYRMEHAGWIRSRRTTSEAGAGSRSTA